MRKSIKAGAHGSAARHDAAVATYALLQSLMASLLEKGAISPAERSAVIERARRTLGKHCGTFAGAAAILDQEVGSWAPLIMH